MVYFRFQLLTVRAIDTMNRVAITTTDDLAKRSPMMPSLPDWDLPRVN